MKEFIIKILKSIWALKWLIIIGIAVYLGGTYLD